MEDSFVKLSAGEHVEAEVKVYVRDFRYVLENLEREGAVLDIERVHERNIRYEDSAQSMTGAGRVLRLRQDNRFRLTYKEPSTNEANGVLSRAEFEVEVSDFHTTDKLLQKLGFSPAWEYEKYRTTYMMFRCEVTLDELPYGNFVEVEGTPENIERVLFTLRLDRYPRVLASYSDLFFRIKERLKLDVQHLTFDNFRHVTVPDDLFV